MTLLRIAIPVTKGKRRFHLDKGRTWSVVEHLILTALTTKSSTALVLADEANLPRRVVLESLIRLMEAGWVELAQRSDGIVFSATQAGKSVASRDELPTNPKRIARWMNFITDRLTGTVYRSRELPIFEKHVLEQRAQQENFIWIEPREIDPNNYVSSVISTLFEDDERFVTMEVGGDRLVERFAVVSYRDGKIEGLPAKSPKELEEIIIAAAKASSPSPKKPAFYRPQPISTEIAPSALEVRSVVFRADDLVLGAEQHRDLLAQVLKSCRHELIIHSTFVAEDKFRALLPQFISAVQRGVRIDILWGQNSDRSEISSTKNAIERLRETIAKSSLDDMIRIHPFSTHSHAKLIVADTGNINSHIAILGSCNWLSSSIQSFEASVRIRDPQLVADVVFQLGDLSLGSDGHWTQLTSYFARLAADVRREAPPAGSRANAHLILGPQHGAIMRQARDTAKKSLFVTSHRLSAAGRPAVILPAIAAAEERRLDVKIYFGIPSGEGAGVKASDVTVEASFAGVRIRPVKEPRVHAKILAWDDDFAAISSQNWLSADPTQGSELKEIGLFINAAGVGRRVRELFEAIRR
jgi:phosphatidylserine/phosphatidylglycerophosphate/cardiolipin synthase-like enzyme